MGWCHDAWKSLKWNILLDQKKISTLITALVSLSFKIFIGEFVVADHCN
jgi:hypothetical protein